MSKLFIDKFRNVIYFPHKGLNFNIQHSNSGIWRLIKQVGDDFGTIDIIDEETSETTVEINDAGDIGKQ